MALATLTAPTASLDDVAAHPLCTLIQKDEEATSNYRFHFASSLCEDCASDDDVLHLASLFITDGLPFTLTVQQPIDQDAIDAEERQCRRDERDLWAAHGPGR